MAKWEYAVESIVLDDYRNVEEGLRIALEGISRDGFKLVSVFPEPRRPSGELHQVPTSDQGHQPYDDVWNTPTGPRFIAVFRVRKAG